MHVSTKDELFDAGYTAPMKPSGYSHVLFIVRMPDTGLWRWSYMERGQVWRNACDQPARFNTSVATVRHSPAVQRLVIVRAECLHGTAWVDHSS